MEWLWTSVVVWLGWNIVAPAITLAVVMLIIGLLGLPRMIRQAQCAHDRYFETRSCDAVCTSCGKNLGFIGTVRAERAALANSEG